MTIPIAVQMYTLRDESKKDFSGTLKRVAEIGYDGVELAGYGGMKPAQLKQVLDNLGLKAISSHIPLDELKTNLETVVEDHQVLDCHFVVCPYLMPDQRKEEDYLSLISFLEQAGETCREAGLTLLYHNHDFELEKLSDGRSALETIFAETHANNVQTELDVYWLTKAGEDPVKWMQRYKNRAPIVHLKDMTVDEEQFFAELGTGGVDLEGVLKTGQECNVKWWVVEQDFCSRSPLESIEISLRYLKEKHNS
ncbi:sugar phosphate isomerase/epimerase [Bacillus sp. FJAT-49736]|uniref:sugar phosphate isomerase/epimerase family protein n=1 Tax=Bacillus sp. FJAT-49736 TaxID=2833582 RepID=UPI001BC8F95A|nr:sugar phosphate isomerase/epimerase [Bacillus sp. FJAT-49736]MBS4172915.1 sugar phosphate isomerase/epimerase [Bacillus sp. FJAT-49736]